MNIYRRRINSVTISPELRNVRRSGLEWGSINMYVETDNSKEISKLYSVSSGRRNLKKSWPLVLLITCELMPTLLKRHTKKLFTSSTSWYVCLVGVLKYVRIILF